MRVYYFILISIFIISCASPYKISNLNNEFKIRDFNNSYSLFSNFTDSIFDVLHDEELKKITNLALANNTDILIYKNRINIAKAQTNIATSAQFPKLDSSLGYSFDGKSNINASLMASWELDIFGKFASIKNSKIEEQKKAIANFDYFKISLISDIVLAYFNIKNLQANISLSKNIISNYYELLFLMDAMYRDGFIKFSDYLENKMSLQVEEQNLNSLLISYEEQKNNLRMLINDMSYEIKEDSISFEELNFHISLDSSLNIILNRPDVRAQIYDLNAAIYNLNSSKANLYPSIRLSGTIGQSLLSPTGIGDLAYQILSSLTLPLFNRQEIYQNIKINDYMRLESFYNLKKIIDKSLSEIDNAIFAFESRKKTLKLSQEILDANNEVLEILKQSNDAGLVDGIDYLKAINNNLSMIKNNNDAYLNALNSFVYLYRSIGGNVNDISDSRIYLGEGNGDK